MFESLSDAEDAFAEIGQEELGREYLRLAKRALNVVRDPSGTHKVGGLPVLESGSSWPTRSALPHAEAFSAWIENPEVNAAWGSERPLPFVAQIDLGAIPGEFAGALPSSGSLAIFWDPLCGCYGRGLENTRVVWVTEGNDVIEVRPPDDSVEVWPEQRFVLSPVWTLPDREIAGELLDVEVPGYGDDDDLDELLSEQINNWGSAESDRVFGWSCPVQSEPFLQAVEEVEGFSDVPVRHSNWEDVEPFLQRHDEWTLLVQLVLSEVTGEPLTEGLLYVYVPTEDAKAGRFDRACGVYQQS